MPFRVLRVALTVAMLATSVVVAGPVTLAQQQTQPEPPKSPVPVPPRRCDHEQPPVTS
jgi:hypothetical protein